MWWIDSQRKVLISTRDATRGFCADPVGFICALSVGSPLMDTMGVTTSASKNMEVEMKCCKTWGSIFTPIIKKISTGDRSGVCFLLERSDDLITWWLLNEFVAIRTFCVADINLHFNNPHVVGPQTLAGKFMENYVDHNICVIRFATVKLHFNDVNCITVKWHGDQTKLTQNVIKQLFTLYVTLFSQVFGTTPIYHSVTFCHVQNVATL